MSKKYIKRPYVIEAVQYTPENTDEIKEFLKERHHIDSTDPCIVTLEGSMKFHEGDYIIKGVDGEFYPCKKEIFEKTYRESQCINLDEFHFSDRADLEEEWIEQEGEIERFEVKLEQFVQSLDKEIEDDDKYEKLRFLAGFTSAYHRFLDYFKTGREEELFEEWKRSMITRKE